MQHHAFAQSRPRVLWTAPGLCIRICLPARRARRGCGTRPGWSGVRAAIL